MKDILFVDDEPELLDSLRARLYKHRHEWNMKFVLSGADAIAALEQQRVDLIVSDVRMPGMDGGQLLSVVKQRWPTTVRIIISGYSDPAQAVRLTSLAHQYIAKPFDISKLRELVQRSFAAQDRIVNKGLQTMATSLRSIPSLPQVHQSLLAELQDNRTAGSVIARMVGEDPGLSIKVLQLANSPLFGQGYVINNPTDAVMCLGTEMIAAIVLSQSLFRHYESLGHAELDLPKVWAHCWETAYLTQFLCRQKRLPRKAAEEGFLAGLLHEAGRFILVDNFPGQFAAACQGARQLRSPLVPRLLETFQTTPAQLTAYLMELWGMPGEVIIAIANQDNPREQGGGTFTLTSALYAADHIASRKSPPDSFALEEWNMTYLREIGCEDDLAMWDDPAFPFDTGQKR